MDVTFFEAKPTYVVQRVSFDVSGEPLEVNELIQKIEELVGAFRVQEVVEENTNTKAIVAISDETDFKDIKLQDLDLMVKTSVSLKQANISSLWDLTQKTEDEVREIHGIGIAGMADIKRKMAEHSVWFKHSNP